MDSLREEMEREVSALTEDGEKDKHRIEEVGSTVCLPCVWDHCACACVCVWVCGCVCGSALSCFFFTLSCYHPVHMYA